MRTLVITNNYPTPGKPHAGPFVADQVRSLREAGVEIELLHLDRLEAGRSVYRGLAATTQARIAETCPDLVHVMYGGVMAEVVARTVRDRPVVVSFGGTDLMGGRDRTVIGSLSRWCGVVASRRAAVRASGIVVKSSSLVDALPAKVDPDRVWIVPNGVDLSRFRPRDRFACQSALGWDHDRRHVLFPAPPARPEKRFELARAAVDALGSDSTSVELHHLEGVPHDEVPTWLNASDALLLTSTHEGSPNAVKEALACDVPVVSVDVGDVRERIETIDGCFIADASPVDLAAKLMSVFARRSRIESRVRMSDLSLTAVAGRLREIYATLVDRQVETGTSA